MTLASRISRALGPLAATLALASLAACNAGYIRNAKLPPAAEGAAYRAAQAVAAPGNGAIYQPAQAFAYFEDPRGRRVGDVITIRLTEAFNASKTASMKTQKDNDTTLSAPMFAGKVPLNGDTTLGAKRAFTGNGTATQQNALTGSITAVVTEVLPNGNLLISGERALQLNQGEEFVRVQGVVRVVDVQADNSVTSDRIADARISYNGQGVIDDANKQGWLARFFASPVTPF
ncbi:MAG TPA: flagellar basal body L-ring protein FlgH [Steroidobacteraceae bacterium]|nr:flagellar basal body L-ring protein FlgH [Steroidobacteraceae bacterium]